MTIVLCGPWNSQPPLGVPVSLDGRNPLTRALRNVFLAANQVRAPGSTFARSADATTYFAVGRNRHGVFIGRGNNNASTRIQPPGETWSVTQSATHVAIITPQIAPTTVSAVVSNSWTSPIVIGDGTNAKLGLAYRMAGDVLTVYIKTSYDVTVGETYYAVAVYENGVGFRFFVNGEKIGEYADTRNIVSAESQIQYFSFAGLHMAASFKRAFSDAEALRMCANPWQIFAPRRLIIPVSAPAATGTTWNVGLTETASLVDTVSTVLTTSASLTETASLSDTVSAILSAVASVTETVSLVDAIAAALNAASDLTETISLADTASAIIGITADLTETVTLTDSSSAELLLGAVVSETVSLTDASTAIATLAAVIQETLSLSDVVSCIATILASVTETASLTDTVNWSTSAVSADLTETITLTDTVTKTATLAAAVSEALSLLDTVVGASTRLASLTETLALVDNVVATLNNATTPLERVLLRSRITQAILERSRVSLELKLRSKLRH